MANNKFYGYTPNPTKEKRSEDTSILDNRLNNINPYEFKKGMDYELVELGCVRLQESTPEERMESTEKVISNLNYHPLYYSGLIHYMTEFRNVKAKPSFKKWITEFHEDTAMKPVTEKDRLREAIKKQIKKSILNEQSDDFDDFDFDDEETTKASTKAGSAKGKGVKSLEKESAKLDKEKDSLKDKMFPLMQAFKAKKKGKRKYTKENYENDLSKIKTSSTSPVASDEAKNDKSKNDHVTDRIKAINKRVEEIEKELDDLILKEKSDKREVAATMMDRQIHKDLLGIISECGIGMNEGAEHIKPYYEIAKMSYMEGLTAGIRKF